MQQAVTCRLYRRRPKPPPTADNSGADYCQLHRSLGGWGPPRDEPWRVLNVPNNGVLIANNIFLNPTGTRVSSRPVVLGVLGWAGLPCCFTAVCAPGMSAVQPLPPVHCRCTVAHHTPPLPSCHLLGRADSALSCLRPRVFLQHRAGRARLLALHRPALHCRLRHTAPDPRQHCVELCHRGGWCNPIRV